MKKNNFQNIIHKMKTLFILHIINKHVNKIIKNSKLNNNFKMNKHKKIVLLKRLTN